MNKLLAFLWNWSATITAALALSLLISIFVIQPTKVEGHSMEPTLQDNHRIYVAKWERALRMDPDYGDIVVIDSRVGRSRSIRDDIAEFPLFHLFEKSREEVFWVKRVIGKGGDELEFRDHKLYRNGERVDETYLKEDSFSFPDGKIVVPTDHLFIMGDNRNHSKDSRSIGFVPVDHVLGRKL